MAGVRYGDQYMCTEDVITCKHLFVQCAPVCVLQNGTGHASHLAALGELSFLVIDEADRMVERGHFQVPFEPLKHTQHRP